MVEEEHAAEAGEDEKECFAATNRRFLQPGAEELRHIPLDGVAACGAEGIGDEVVHIAGAAGEQL